LLEFRILGALEVVDDDRPLTLGAPKQRAVLAVLLLHRGEVVSIDRLVDELWGQHPPSSATKAVQVYVSNLRKALGNGLLVTRGRGYALEAEGGQLDADQFQARATEGSDALAEGDAQLASARLREALALWRGPALADFAYEPFAQGEAARLEEERLAALEDRIDADLALGRHTALIGELDALVREHPLRERLQAQLMLALYRSGRQADALERYQQARRKLIDELGIEPGRELQELERSILAQDPALGGARRPLPQAVASHRVVRLLALAGVLLVAAAVAATIKLLDGQGGSAGLASASSDSVALISVGTSRLQASFPVGGSPSSLAVGAGAVWALNADDQTLTRVDLGSHTEHAYGTDGIPVDLAVGDRSVWVVNGSIARAHSAFRGAPIAYPEPTSVSRLDPITAATVKTISLPQATADQPPTSYQIAVGPQGVWVINAAGSVSRIDPASNRIAQTVRGVSVSAIASGVEGTWAIENTDLGSIVQLTPDHDRVARRIPVPTAQQATALSSIAVGASAVWATDPQTGLLWRIDPGPVPSERTIALAPGASDVTYGAGAVWVANGSSGTVSRIDPRTNQVTDTIAVGNTPGKLSVGEGGVWVAVTGTNGVSLPAASADQAGIASLPASLCGHVLSGSDGRPQRLIVSDFPLRAGTSIPAQQMTAAIAYVLREHDFRAGRVRLGYQSCDDSTSQTGYPDPHKCTSNANAWVNHPVVLGVIGPYNSGCAISEIPIANNHGPLAIVSPTNSLDALTHSDPLGPAIPPGQLYPTGRRNYVSVYPGDGLQAAAMAKFARRHSLSNVYVLYDDPGSFGQSTALHFKAAAHRLGLHLAGSSAWQPPQRNYRRLAAKVARSGASAVYLGATGDDADTGTLIRALHDRLGDRVKLLTSETFIPVAQLFHYAGTAARSLYISSPLAPAGPLPPAGRQFLTRFAATQHGKAVNPAALYAAQATELMIDAIARSNGTRSSVARALLHTCARNAIIGDFCVDANGNPTVAPVTILTADTPGALQQLDTSGTKVVDVIDARSER
jgi:YVTN family beta-propeller protein